MSLENLQERGSLRAAILPCRKISLVWEICG
jgi:hypothetical protein